MNDEIYENYYKKPGRPRALPDSIILEILDLYNHGFGYRSITRQLEKKGITVDWSSVRRLIKRHCKPEQNHYNGI